MRWSEEQTHQFVKIYLKQENLWNAKHINYRNAHFRLKSYKEILTEFSEQTGIHMNISDLKIKIKNLRSTYTQEVNKIKQRSNENYRYKTNLKWFHDWHSRIQQNITEQNLPNETEDSEIWLETDMSNEHSDINPFMEDDYSFIKVEPNDSSKLRDCDPCNTKPKKTKWRSESIDNNSVDTFRGSLDSTTTKEDEFDIYGKYIASQLRKMDLQKALRLQLDIQSLISEARISDLAGK